MRAQLHRAGWLLAGVLALFVVAAFSGVVGGGPLDPEGPPAPTRPLVEPRIPISPTRRQTSRSPSARARIT
jgi:hypothetical protein